jgi:hypothetical protein
MRIGIKLSSGSATSKKIHSLERWKTPLTFAKIILNNGSVTKNNYE